MVNLEEYDCIGFDLDNTLLEYDVPNMSELIYNSIANFLIKQRCYPSVHLAQPLSSSSNFLQRGLALDFSRGNIVKIGVGGEVLKASHGTTMLSLEEIKSVYGPNAIWVEAREYEENPFEAWNGPLSKKIRCLLDYFDMPMSLVFARAIDTLDMDNSIKESYAQVWLDILDGLTYNYSKECFAGDLGEYFPAVKKEPAKFLKKCPEVVRIWLQSLKDNGKLLYLITGSAIDYASFTSNFSIGESWKNLFDVIVCFAGKPAFFKEERHFLALDGFVETVPVKLDGRSRIISRGNWRELYQFFVDKTGKTSPQTIYIGDNMLQDVLAPQNFSDCHAIAVCNELQSDVKSVWGSYFEDEKGRSTLWNSILKSSKGCVRDLTALAKT